MSAAAETTGGSMNRRQVLSGVGFLAAAATTVEQARSQSSAGVPNIALVATASACVSKGQLCLSHCLDMLATGDKSMGACSKTAREMLAVCDAMLSLAAQGAPSVSRFAAVCLDVCKRCEAECRKHVQHTPCKDCATACAACQVECRKVAA
jgi:Cys-rich four helix bundle protein (predicted Tat secretion target)